MNILSHEISVNSTIGGVVPTQLSQREIDGVHLLLIFIVFCVLPFNRDETNFVKIGRLQLPIAVPHHGWRSHKHLLFRNLGAQRRGGGEKLINVEYLICPRPKEAIVTKKGEKCVREFFRQVFFC